MPDIFGLEELEREPAGLVSLESLKGRPSRRLTLFQLLDCYAGEEYSAERFVLTDLLQRAAVRLGPPQKQSDLGDPRFMARHALNRIDPKNWRRATVQIAESPREGWEYVSPPAERDHLKPLQDELREPIANLSMEFSIRAALNSARGSSTVFAAAAVKWAQEMASKPTKNETEQLMREEAIVSAAVIAARDGSKDLVATHGDWIRETFRRAFKGKDDPAHRMRDGLQFNPIAIAFLGIALLLKNRFEMADVRTLLGAAGDDNPAAAQGFHYVAGVLAAVDERLPRAVLRCAFSACVHPVPKWGMASEDHKARLEVRHREVTGTIEAELAWLDEGKTSPHGPPSNHHMRILGTTIPQADDSANAMIPKKGPSSTRIIRPRRCGSAKPQVSSTWRSGLGCAISPGLIRTGPGSRTARTWPRRTIPTESRMSGTMRISTCSRVASLG